MNKCGTGLPAWWVRAIKVRERVASLPTPDNDVELTREFGTAYTAANSKVYTTLSATALRGMDVAAVPWKPVRDSFSLTNVQLALCYTFAVATGIFLWVLYGDLRRIDGSLLTLLGTSVTSAGVSWAADRDVGGRPDLPSRGYWADLARTLTNSSRNKKPNVARRNAQVGE